MAEICVDIDIYVLIRMCYLHTCVIPSQHCLEKLPTETLILDDTKCCVKLWRLRTLLWPYFISESLSLLTWSSWTTWSIWSKPCFDPCFDAGWTRTQTRSRSCRLPETGFEFHSQLCIDLYVGAEEPGALKSEVCDPGPCNAGIQSICHFHSWYSNQIEKHLFI